MSDTGTAAAMSRDVSRVLTRASRSNFYYAFLFLPRAQRDALYAVYAFCRVTDDLVDEATPPAGTLVPAGPPPPAGRFLPAGNPPPACVFMPTGTPIERLKAWRAELDACFRGEPTHPVTQRLAETILAFRIPHAYFEELLNGVEMDLTKSRYATLAELQQYCYRVAGVVGLMCIEIFGYRHPATRTYAERLGTAFQLTNILRDLGTDADRGRIYLPQEDLERFGIAEADVLARRKTPAFDQLMRFEVGRARQMYATAENTLPSEDRPRMLAAKIMGDIYSRILDKIEDANYDVFSRRVRLSNAYRLWLATRCWARHRLRPS